MRCGSAPSSTSRASARPASASCPTAGTGHHQQRVVAVHHGGALLGLRSEYLTTRKDELVGWARKFSIFPYPFVTACCAMEFMAVSSTPYDTDRFGAALPRFSPRQSDLLMVVGTVTHKQAPVLKVYEQMCEPKWVMAFGACATSGGFYQNYAALPGIDKIIPVDVYIPGCPPRPEMVIDAIMRLQDQIASAPPHREQGLT
jgi:NADH-quinone oxidoreductase subunit B